MKYIKRISLLILFILIQSLPAFSLKIPAAPLGRVSDWAGIMSEESKADINSTLQAFEDNTGIQIAVAVFPSLEGESLEDFSIHLAEKWKIGQKGKDNGVILLAFITERKMRIEVGYGLEDVLPDADASSIIRNVIAPRFKTGDYAGGIKEGVNSIIKVISGGEAPPAEEENTSFYGLNKQKITQIALIIAGFIAFLFLIDIFRFGGYASSHRNYQQRYSFIEWLIIFSITFAIIKLLFYILLSGRSRGGFGGGSSGWGGGGGFGGGGGSFGGGGSSGSW